MFLQPGVPQVSLGKTRHLQLEESILVPVFQKEGKKKDMVSETVMQF